MNGWMWTLLMCVKSKKKLPSHPTQNNNNKLLWVVNHLFFIHVMHVSFFHCGNKKSCPHINRQRYVILFALPPSLSCCFSCIARYFVVSGDFNNGSYTTHLSQYVLHCMYEMKKTKSMSLHRDLNNVMWVCVTFTCLMSFWLSVTLFERPQKHALIYSYPHTHWWCWRWCWMVGVSLSKRFCESETCLLRIPHYIKKK